MRVTLLCGCCPLSAYMSTANPQYLAKISVSLCGGTYLESQAGAYGMGAPD